MPIDYTNTQLLNSMLIVLIKIQIAIKLCSVIAIKRGDEFLLPEFKNMIASEKWPYR